MLQTLTNEELADRLGLSDRLLSEGDSRRTFAVGRCPLDPPRDTASRSYDTT